MIQDIITAIISYLGTTSDYFVVLLLLFGQYKTKESIKSVIYGAYLGNAILVLVSLLIAWALKEVPATWLLGLLGIIPIIMGIKNFISNTDESNEVNNKLGHIPQDRIVRSVILITVAACGADNTALYIPYFTTVDFALLPIVFMIFVVILTLVIYAAMKLIDVKVIGQFFDKHGSLIQLVIYTGLGIYILFESGTISHFIGR
ncbi:cadmium resistance transporter [Lactobacillaceae bacterium Melli_B4]